MCPGYLVGCGWWGGWWVVGVLVLVSGFRGGAGSGVGVSGGWGCSVGGFWFLGGGWCGACVVAPLRPLLNSPPPGRLVCCGSWFGPSLCWVVVAVRWWVSCVLQFFSGGVGWSCGWLVLLVVFWLGCSRPGVVAEVLVGCSGSAVWLLGVFRGGGLRGLCLRRGVVLLLVVLFPLGGPTWTVGLFVAPLPLPPLYTAGLPGPPDSVGELTR